MEAWSCEKVAEWLEASGFGEFAQTFLENEISGAILPDLTNEILRDDLQIKALGRRAKILAAIRDINDRDNVLDLAVLHAAPLVLRIYPKDAPPTILAMEKLDLEAERLALQQALNSGYLGRIRLRFDVATTDSFRALLTAWQCKVLHFSGHGVGHNEMLCFEDGAGCTHMISPKSLRELIYSGAVGATDLLQVVFVSSCHSERLANVFVEAGVPHVVAVHSDSRILDSSGNMFAKHFYLSLFAGRSVLAAFDIAKTAVRALPPTNKRACCCAHLHERTCQWALSGMVHARHPPNRCCCKGETLPWPHDESSKFLLLGQADASLHDVVIFPKLPRGKLVDLTPHCPSNLPAMHGQFVGRNVDTYNLVRSIVQGNVTVCTGAPGIGKSSLVIAAAHFVLQRRICPDGVFYVDLEGLAGLEFSAVLYAIAQSVGLPVGENTTDSQLFAELGSKRCLLVLDKVEELLDRDQRKCEAFLGQLVATAHHTRLLLGSRRIPDIANVTVTSVNISELPLKIATELILSMALQCSPVEAERLATICGKLPLALRVVGRALANTRSNVTPQDLIERLQVEDHRLEEINNLSETGQKECLDRCIRSSFTQLDAPLRLAFMALGLFRGVFDMKAACAVLQSFTSPSPLMKTHSSPSILSSSTPSMFAPPSYSRQYGSSNALDECASTAASSAQSLGWELYHIDDCFDKDDALTTMSYSLLNLESQEEVTAHASEVAAAIPALEQLNQWSLVEKVMPMILRKTTRHVLPQHARFRLHNMIQLFAEDEAAKFSVSSPEGAALFLAWRRRFVRHYCLVIANASHAFRYEGSLTLFDSERSNIESALRIAHQLSKHSEETARERMATGCEDDDGGYAPFIDVLLHSNLMVRGRFIFRARMDPRFRLRLFATSIQFSKTARVLNCKCGHIENNSTILDTSDMPSSYEPSQAPEAAPPCACPGVMELLALEVLMVMEMGYAHYDVNEDANAEHMYRESLRIQQEVLHRTDHSHVAEALNYLGIVLSMRRGFSPVNAWKFRKAEALLLQAKEIRERVLGPVHPDYATSLNNLGNFYKSALTMLKDEGDSSSMGLGYGGVLLKTNDEIQELYEKSLSIYEAHLGKDHPLVARSLNNMALFLVHITDKRKPSPQKMSEIDAKIEQLYLQALDIRRKKLGNKNPETAATLNNLGNHKYNQGQYAAAETYLREALTIRQQYYSNTNDRVSVTLLNLARILVAQEKYKEAEMMYREAEAIRQVLMPNSRELGFCIEKIGRCMLRQGLEDEGKKLISKGQHMKRQSGFQSRRPSTDSFGSFDTASVASESFNDSFKEQLYIHDVLSDEALSSPDFNVEGQIIGKQGANLRRIEKESGAQFVGTCEDAVAAAKTLTIEHLKDIQFRFEKKLAQPPGASTQATGRRPPRHDERRGKAGRAGHKSHHGGRGSNNNSNSSHAGGRGAGRSSTMHVSLEDLLHKK
ncbi:hypothetical protein SPRG_10776 [Saprolegnia parasitica CBS 223.65]|uniref:SAM domain-containing protein n=1 Tax=Saprolegnia parasitica (strain CBS 223.65) TaxID=695850 RepID=A0A067CAL0_SAPPC|nr:hypothetical protein SPRG_10776 [Saprolegnia parasitica CBS 223.65]KDO23581.1 hypothetical protein SPRG_10776 [Saprolegnia parasitica CBS 223.65]|eukprot:XP_012205729.1 hypothetical protein SPRG_10776 [Saprolegnia parasitica CBS 223.65]